MHIPDGFIATSVSGIFYGVSGSSFYWSLQKLRTLSSPLLGILSAYIFVAQIINFPIVVGASGHLLGTTLATVLLGFYGSVITVSVVLFVQALFFADGGILALGMNVFNLAILPSLTTILILKLAYVLLPHTKNFFLSTVAFAAWISIPVTGLGFLLQFQFGGTASVDVSTIAPALLGIQSFLGIVESIITVVSISFILTVRKDIVSSYQNFQDKHMEKKWL